MITKERILALKDKWYGSLYADVWPVLESLLAERDKEQALRERYEVAIRTVVGQFDALKEHQENLLVRGQDLASASKNWEEATTMGPGIDLNILKEALTSVSEASLGEKTCNCDGCEKSRLP